MTITARLLQLNLIGLWFWVAPNWDMLLNKTLSTVLFPYSRMHSSLLTQRWFVSPKMQHQTATKLIFSSDYVTNYVIMILSGRFLFKGEKKCQCLIVSDLAKCR